MDLDLTDEQQMIIDMTRGMLEEHSTADIVRLVEDDPKGYPDELWKQMSELGLNGLLIPESYGGGGQTVLEGAFVYEELGRAMAPTPHFVSCVMSAGVLLEAGVDVAMMVLPSGMDPDDVIRESGEATFREILEHPTSLLEFLLAELPPDPAARRRSGLELATLVCSASDPAVRQNLIEELARQLYLRPREIEEHGEKRRRGAKVAAAAVRSPMPPGERELARILLECSNEWRSKILEIVHVEYIRDVRVRRLLEDTRSIVSGDDSGTDFLHELLSHCTDPDASTLVAELSTSPMPEITDDSIRVQLKTLLQRQAREGSQRLEPQIAAAEKRGDHAEVDRLLAEKTRLRRDLAEI